MHRVLIPVFSPEQLTDEFILEATKTADVVILLEVIDPNDNMSAEEIASRTEEVNFVVSKIEKNLHRRGVRFVFSKEWGNREEKIKSTFMREHIDKIAFPHGFPG